MTGLQAHLDQSKYKRVCRIERWTRFLLLMFVWFVWINIATWEDQIMMRIKCLLVYGLMRKITIHLLQFHFLAVLFHRNINMRDLVFAILAGSVPFCGNRRGYIPLVFPIV